MIKMDEEDNMIKLCEIDRRSVLTGMLTEAMWTYQLKYYQECEDHMKTKEQLLTAIKNSEPVQVEERE